MTDRRHPSGAELPAHNAPAPAATPIPDGEAASSAGPDCPPGPAERTRQTVTPTADSRLAQLLELYGPAKEAADAAAEQLKTITDAIKAELRDAAPDATAIELGGPVPLRLTAVSSWRLDTKALKAAEPLVYVRYAKQSTAWRLEAVRP